jgi:Domain of unknown function (DUF5668)
MVTQDQNNTSNQRRRDRDLLAGLFLLFIGVMFFFKEFDFPFFPTWFFTWPMILIVVGIYSGFRNQFRNTGWMILVLVGSFFLFDRMGFPFGFHRFLIPALIVGVAFILILRPNRYHNDCRNRREDRSRY